jgi:hypothetical protein
MKPSAAIHILGEIILNVLGSFQKDNGGGGGYETNEKHGPHLRYELTLNMLCVFMYEFTLTM